MVRQTNQDSYIIERLCSNAALCVVCDGMGGAKSGNVASECAAEVFAARVRKYSAAKIHGDVMELDSDDACAILDDSAHDANTAVFKKSQTSPDYQGMGTTLVAALFCGDMVYVINVGDSRLYLVGEDAITQITHDHSYVQHLVDSGSLTPEEARTHPFRNRITRAVGIWEKLECDIFSVDLSELEKCWMLLCSDGLSGMLTEDEILSVVSADGQFADDDEELSSKTEKLIEAANDEGGTDNITAVLVKFTNSLCDDSQETAD